VGGATLVLHADDFGFHKFGEERLLAVAREECIDLRVARSEPLSD
jgi:hypothetical protein